MPEGNRAFCTSEINLEACLQDQVGLHVKVWLPKEGCRCNSAPLLLERNVYWQKYPCLRTCSIWVFDSGINVCPKNCVSQEDS